MILSDKALVDCAIKHLDKVFPDFIFSNTSCRPSRQAVLECLTAAQAYFADGSLAPHSLFRFQANAERSASTVSLKSLWQQLNNCAVMLLRWHDRRENVSRSEGHYVRIEDNTELFDYFSKVSDFERILYATDSWYRDHFAHVVRVWMTGIYVVFELNNAIRPPEIHPEVNSVAFDPIELFSAFTIAALCHDLGYPIEKTSKLNDKVAEMFGSFGGLNWSRSSFDFTPQRHELSKLLIDYLSGTVHYSDERGGDEPLESTALSAGLKSIVAEYAQPKAKTIKDLAATQESAFRNRVRIGIRSQHTYHRKYSDSLETNDHGILSAMILLRKVRFFKEGEFSNSPRNFLFEEIRQYLLRRDILRACASHTCRDIYFLHPLSLESLLFFCDELQEWGRPRFSDLQQMDPESLGALTVKLVEYNQGAISWEIDAGFLKEEAGLKWSNGLARKFFNAQSGPVNIFDSNGGSFKLAWTMRWKVSPDQPEFSTVTFTNGGAGDSGGANAITFQYIDAAGNSKSLINKLEAKSLGL